MDRKSILEIFYYLLGSGSFTIFVVIYLFKNPDKFEHWARLFYTAIHFFTSKIPIIRKKIDKSLVAYSIQDTVNHIAFQLDKEAPGIFPHAMKIEWVDSQNPESFLSKGKAIVRLKHYSNKDRNIVDSTLFFIKKAFLPRAKNYIDRTLRDVCEFKIASKIFSHRNSESAFDYFIENIINPAIVGDQTIKQDLQLLEEIDSVGYFTRIFLNEVRITSQKLIGAIPTETVKRELREFADFLEIIALKAKEERVPLDFRGVKVKATVILIANPTTINNYGTEPYTNRVKWAIKEGFETIYLTAWGDRFLEDVLEIKSKIERELVSIIRRYEYPIHGTNKAILLACAPKASFLAKQKELHDEVSDCLIRFVPEIKNGEITIHSISRIRKVGFKVALKSESEKHLNPKDLCFGPEGEILKNIKNAFKDEFVSLINWTDNYKRLIVDALRPLNDKYIEEIIIDEENLIADIKVLNRESAAKAIGKNGNNVKLASELTGFIINVDLSNSLKKEHPPEEEINSIIRKVVPEIHNDEIEIVSTARLKGIGSKVIVKWSIENIPHDLKASSVCIGRNNGYINEIRKYFPNEWIGFHDFSEKSEDQIATCLYPIKNQDIKSIEIDDVSNLAVITLKNQKDHSDRELNEDNLALCELVTGYQIEII